MKTSSLSKTIGVLSDRVAYCKKRNADKRQSVSWRRYWAMERKRAEHAMEIILSVSTKI